LTAVRRAALLVLAALLGARVAAAQPAVDAGGPDPLASAQAELSSALAQAASSDCATACLALGSLQRAAEQICSIDPGPPCADARARYAKAASQVRASCPDCSIPPLQPETVPPPPPPPPSPASAPKNEVTAESPAQAEAAPPQRGCASCAIGGRPGDSSLPVALFAIGALAARSATRRRRRGV
jgi:MYXO-CTERM domain-containing protein